MKIYLWTNGNMMSDFTDKANMVMSYGYNAHSGGIVVLAENEVEARELAKKYTKKDPLECQGGVDEYGEFDFVKDTTPIIIPLDKKGVVIFADGCCT